MATRGRRIAHNASETSAATSGRVEAPDAEREGKAEAERASSVSLPSRLVDLVPAADNPRRISDDARRGLAESVLRFGDLSGIVFNRRTGRLVAAHQRREVLLASGVDVEREIEWSEPVAGLDGTEERIGELDLGPGLRFRVRLVDWSDAVERAANVAANDPRIAGEFTFGLREFLAPVRANEELFSRLGFSDLLGDLGQLEEVGEFRAPKKGGVSNPGDARETPDVVALDPVTVAGDVWLLDDRIRLVCGDCRDPKVVDLATRGEELVVLAMDPPYCSGGYQEAHRAAGTYGQVAADNLSTRGFQALIREALSAARASVAYVFTDWRQWANLVDLLEAGGLASRGMIVWDKGWSAWGGLWRPTFELVAFSSRISNTRSKGVASKGAIIRANRTGNKWHYTEKPVEVFRALFEGDAIAEGRADAFVLDSFAGSCSSLLALRLLGRRGAGIEVEPPIVDVALRRWRETTGLDPVRERDGRTYSSLVAERGGTNPPPPKSSKKGSKRTSSKA